MSSISEFCRVCGQIEDLEHLFLTCAKSEQVWKHFTLILKKFFKGKLWQEFPDQTPKTTDNFDTIFDKDDPLLAMDIPLCLSF